MARGPNFDRIARPYRWMEYATLGLYLEKTRFEFLPRLMECRRALVLGDGDGRFLAELLRRNTQVRADAVDASGAMLALLLRRTGTDRVTAHEGNALAYEPEAPVDLISTHFFLDCLTQVEVDGLVSRLVGRLVPGGLWVVSEFRIPEGGMRWVARAYVGMLYGAFAILTGLRVRRLPDFAAAFERAGMVLVGRRYRLLGLLTSELWQHDGNARAEAGKSALQ